ncbi:hypothetical protein NCCP1664_28700 [Zafaria cholistanensis]|uniref:Uncharacterized protein n=1 Tax=Zafaria cholistanensis TaxID=1682741 RepID=A0A5A7NU28_9MICC|nr:cell division protein FtsQ/DivIB [Zafaria cholistanensis]GER24375.1 hypothetical protein NCCP1664_28700 [Zafaria cholistanensis]
MSARAASGRGTAPAADNVLTLPQTPAARLRRRVLLWTGGVLAGIAAMLLVLMYSPLLAIRSIDVEGNRLASDGAVAEALEPLVGVPLPQVGPGRVLQLLSGLAPVADVVVQAKAPHTLQVSVVEHAPVAVLKDGRKLSLVGEDGRKLAPLAKRSDAQLPVISASAATADPAVFRTLTRVLAGLPAPVLARLEHAGAKTIDSVELTLSNGKTVVWGNEERGAQKARVLQALLKVKDDPSSPVEVYDVSSPDQPVTR